MRSRINILVLNAGSSSLKFEVFAAAGKSLTSLAEGQVDNHGKPITDFQNAVAKAVRSLSDIKAVGHRVVHGGELFSRPTKITRAVIGHIRKLSRLAPLHNPPNLACILAAKKIFPQAVHVAVFDTAFHQTMLERAFLYGLPYSLSKKFGIRRYGFHGTSHQYVFEQARKKLGRAKTRRTITCHLGNGCSMTAILDGKAIDTSMGFTPLEGLPMGTRCGDLDPSIIFFLMEKGFSPREAETMLNTRSGLAGVSEISSDMRALRAAEQKGSAKARRALEWFAYRIAKYLGAYTVALGGLDCLVFTGGMGEHAWYLRKRVLKYLKGLARPRVLVIPTDEEKQIAQEVLRVTPQRLASTV